jgi:hypothetical protein
MADTTPPPVHRFTSFTRSIFPLLAGLLVLLAAGAAAGDDRAA